MIPQTPTTPGTGPTLVFDPNGGTPIVTVTPDGPNGPSAPGTIVVVFEACTTITLTGETNCDTSGTLTINIHDPCPDAIIAVSDIKSIMQAPILGSHELDSLNLFSELGAQWPWSDSVTIAADSNVGLCGPLEYFITNASFAPTDLVLFSEDMSTLLLRPTLDDAPGGRMVDLKLVARLRDYPQVEIGYDSFKVFIMDCQATINP